MHREGWVRAHVVRILIAVAVFAALGAPARAARADGDEVKGNVAGAVGLGLLGAEVGLFLPPAFKLQDRWWAWVLFPTLGAAGGALAGGFAFDEGDPGPAVTVSLLGAGMALVLPAVVGALAFKNKRQNAEPKELEGGAVLRLGKVDRHWGVPAVTSVPVYASSEQTRWGLRQRSMLRVSLVSGRF